MFHKSLPINHIIINKVNLSTDSKESENRELLNNIYAAKFRFDSLSDDLYGKKFVFYDI